MNKNATYIKNRLSLRPPQSESLEILSGIVDRLTLKKNSGLANELAKIKDYTAELESGGGYANVFTEFERNFPCVCFALATGVGKTRLMGAFIAYLNQEKGIKNFFVLAPSLTIYNKLIEDFSNPRNPKYVFPGIGDFVHRPPGIITGDNYTSRGTLSLFEESININVFNISKINAETKGGKLPRIKRLSEYIGQSYFDHLSSLDDLVLLMDESHHYRAERGMQVINELNPVLGIEVTATPKTESGGTRQFKNVVYQYGLGRAMDDGFVKEPAIATRKDFDPSHYKQEELDRIKLEDGVRIHEDTKVALEIYSRDVKKWMRPAPKQFKIYWDHNARMYEPDFVAETDTAVYLVEIKMEKDMDAREVQEKAKAALEYCGHATEYTLNNGGKPWKYLLIPHDEVLPNMSFGYLVGRREFVG